MSIKKISEMIKLIELGNPRSINEKELSSLAKELNNCAEFAQGVITEKIDEETFVRCLRMVEGAVTFSMAIGGSPEFFVMAGTESLRMYTHTVILATIGLLIQDEVL